MKNKLLEKKSIKEYTHEQMQTFKNYIQRLTPRSKEKVSWNLFGMTYDSLKRKFFNS